MEKCIFTFMLLVLILQESKPLLHVSFRYREDCFNQTKGQRRNWKQKKPVKKTEWEEEKRGKWGHVPERREEKSGRENLSQRQGHVKELKSQEGEKARKGKNEERKRLKINEKKAQVIKERGTRSWVLGTFCYRMERLHHRKYCVWKSWEIKTGRWEREELIWIEKALKLGKRKKGTKTDTVFGKKDRGFGLKSFVRETRDQAPSPHSLSSST